MIYYEDTELVIREMAAADPQIFCREERAQGWHSGEEKFRTRLNDHRAGACAALVAEYRGSAAGYLNVYFDAQRGPFAGQGLCELVDFGVLEKYRRLGIGTRLIDAAERIAAERADTAYLGVGLHSGYGSAQRMYIKRGYVPDGSGVWYGDAVCEPYGACRNDDDLVLYMSKKLR